MTESNLSNWHILHVDDDEDDHLIVGQMLQGVYARRVTLEWAVTLDEGRRKLQTNHYDAVLVDYDLGAGSGIDLIREEVQRDDPAPLILLTGRGSYEVDMEAMRAGATLYLTKTEMNPLLLERSIRYAIERKQSEAALQESEARFRDLANHISQLAWMADAEGKIFWFNQRWFDYTGETPENMHAMSWTKANHPDYVGPVTASFLEAVKTGRDWEDTFPLRGADGKYRWFLSRATPIFNPDGSVRRWFGTNTDVTDTLRLEQENQRQKYLLERLVQAAPVAIAFFQGPQHVFSLPNTEYESLARGKGHLIGRSVRDVWPEAAEILLPQLARVYQTGEPFSIRETPLQLQRAEGLQQTYLTYTLTPILRADGSIEGVMALVIDSTEQVGNRRALEQQAARLDPVLQALPVGVWIADELGRLVLKNRQADRIWAGDSPLAEGVEEYSLYTAYLPGSETPLTPDEYPLARTLQTGEAVEPVELRIRRFDGTPGDILVSTAPILDAAGRLRGAVGINVDITGRKKVEEAVRASERNAVDLADALEFERAKLSAAIETLPVGMGIGDPHGDVLTLNAAGLRLHGFNSESEMISKLEGYHQQFELRYPDGQPMPPDEWPVARALRGEYVQDFEVTLINVHSGETCVIAYSSAPVLNLSDELVLIVYVMLDITERKKIEGALRNSEERYRQLADAMPQLVWTAMPDGQVDYYNQRHALYGGIAPTQEGSWEWGPAVHADELQATLDAWNEAVRSGNTYQIEHRIKMADGSYRWHLSRGIPAFDERGVLVKWFGTATDIHEFKLVQADLSEYAERLKRSNEELQNFAFVASHDLQEPLRKIQMFGDLLQRQMDHAGGAAGVHLDGESAVKAQDFVARMQDASTRMQAMISGLLDLSRVSTREQVFTRVNLNAVAKEVVSDLEAQVRLANAHVRVEPLPDVLGDERQLRRMLQNLVGNALKFHKPETPPTVQGYGELVSTSKGQRARIVVSDNGIGFDPAEAERLFQPFVRLHGRSRYEGNGIGLAICKKIIDRHGGEIIATSTPGEGSRFIVILPT